MKHYDPQSEFVLRKDFVREYLLQSLKLKYWALITLVLASLPLFALINGFENFLNVLGLVGLILTVLIILFASFLIFYIFEVEKCWNQKVTFSTDRIEIVNFSSEPQVINKINIISWSRDQKTLFLKYSNNQKVKHYRIIWSKEVPPDLIDFIKNYLSVKQFKRSGL